MSKTGRGTHSIIVHMHNPGATTSNTRRKVHDSSAEMMLQSHTVDVQRARRGQGRKPVITSL